MENFFSNRFGKYLLVGGIDSSRGRSEMTLNPIVEWLVFGCFASIAIAGALGMATTMSMFRSGVFWMASFIGVTGLFILAVRRFAKLLQVDDVHRGMLVVILFIVLFSHDQVA